MATDTYKLTYFNLTGLGETIRFLLAYGGIDFQDIRVEDDQWDALKPSKHLLLLKRTVPGHHFISKVIFSAACNTLLIHTFIVKSE